MVRQRCENVRDKRGQFVETTGSTIYKTQQRKGKRLGVHVINWQNWHRKELPKDWCVHHKDGNKKNNNVNNLEAMPIAEHTKKHFDEYYKTNNVWNKGRTTHAGNNDFGHTVTDKTKQRKRVHIFSKHIESWLDIWKLKEDNLTPTQISKELNITIDKVNRRWKAFNKIYDIDSGRIK